MYEKSMKDYCNVIKENLEKIGVSKGDILYVASDVSQMIKRAQIDLGFKDKETRNDFLNLVIDAIQEILGQEGTLLFPMYNWDFCKGITFDYRHTKSKVGALNNFVLEKRPEFRRTRHPIYSFMVWGKEQSYLCALDNQEAFGANSPFAYLDQNNAKQLSLGVDMTGGITFLHYVEQFVQVPYRHHKFFLGQYEDENGCVEFRAYSQYVRDLSVQYKFILKDDFFREKKVVRESQIYDWKISLAELPEIKKVLEEDLRKGAKNIYEIDNYDIKDHFNKSKYQYEIGFLKEYELV